MPNFLTCPAENPICNNEQVFMGDLIYYNLQNVDGDRDYSASGAIYTGDTYLVENLSPGYKVRLPTFNGTNIVIKDSFFNHTDSGGTSDLSFNGQSHVENFIIINSTGIRFMSNQVHMKNLYMYNVQGTMVLPYRAEPVLNVYSYADEGHTNSLNNGSSFFYSRTKSIENFYVVGNLMYTPNSSYLVGGYPLYVSGNMKIDGLLTIENGGGFGFMNGSHLEIYIDENDTKFTGEYNTMTTGLNHYSPANQKAGIDFENGSDLTVYMSVKPLINSDTVSYELIRLNSIKGLTEINYYLPAWYDLSWRIDTNTEPRDSSSLILSSNYNYERKKEALNSCNVGSCNNQDVKALANYYLELTNQYMQDSSKLTEQEIETIVNLELASSVNASVDASGNSTASIEESTRLYYGQLAIELPLNNEVYTNRILASSKFIKNLINNNDKIATKDGFALNVGSHSYDSYNEYYGNYTQNEYQGVAASFRFDTSKEKRVYLNVAYHEGDLESRLYNIKEQGITVNINSSKIFTKSLFGNKLNDYIKFAGLYSLSNYNNTKNNDVSYKNQSNNANLRFEYGTIEAKKGLYFKMGYFAEPLFLYTSGYEEGSANANENYKTEASSAKGYRFGANIFAESTYRLNGNKKIAIKPSLFAEISPLKINGLDNRSTLIGTSEILPETIDTKGEEINDIELYLKASLRFDFNKKLALSLNTVHNSLLKSNSVERKEIKDTNFTTSLMYLF